MESWHSNIFLKFATTLGFVSAAYIATIMNIALAENTLDVEQEPIVNAKLERQEFKAAKIDTENWEIGAYYGLMSVEDFGVNTVYGARLAYHATERVFFEAVYGKTTTEKTSYERLSGAAQLLTDDERDLTYYNLSLGFNLLPGETFVSKGWTFNNELYVIGGVGSTKFASENRFTMNFGAGYRLIATDWLAFHADVRDHIFDIDLLGEEKTTHNIEIHGGLTFFF